jgi:hypothetical protein
VQYRCGLPSPERQPVFVQLVRGVLAQQLLHLVVEQLAEQALRPLKRQRSTIKVWLNAVNRKCACYLSCSRATPTWELHHVEHSHHLRVISNALLGTSRHCLVR